jgi:hypothetical protein
MEYWIWSGSKNRPLKRSSQVAAAYGWSDYTPEMNDTKILQSLLQLNLAR